MKGVVKNRPHHDWLPRVLLATSRLRELYSSERVRHFIFTARSRRSRSTGLLEYLYPLDMAIYGTQHSGILIPYPAAFLQKNLIFLPFSLRRPDVGLIGKFVIDHALSNSIER